MSLLDQKRSVAAALLLLVAAAPTLAQTRQSPPPDDATEAPKIGAISGRVVNESGQPIPNASVFVRAFNSTGQGGVTSTDGEGNFQVNGLEPVAYLVSASFPAYTSPPRDPDNAQAGYYRVGESVTLVLIKGGVITGTVTNATGEPIVGVPVRAYMRRDGNNQPLRYGATFRDHVTDDRGVYRIYGLAPGSYVVSAGGGSNYFGYDVNAFYPDTPTFAPSSTADTATLVNVRGGEETNVDIRYRGEAGHIISGTVNGPVVDGVPARFNIVLTATSEGGSQWSNSSFQPPGSPAFIFYGIADGDYDVTAQTFIPGGDWSVSEPRRIKVRGADITGIELTTKPLGSITGRVALEESKAVECQGKRRPLFTETLISAWHNENSAAKDQPQFLWSLGGPAYPNKQGEITLRNLAPGQYRLIARFFAKYWYLRSISWSSGAPAGTPAQLNRLSDAARNWTTLKSGDRLSGLVITLAAGAASLRGQVTTNDGEKRPARLFVFLVPAEREKGEDVLRFFAAPVASDGNVILNNIAPGSYWIVEQTAGDNDPSPLSKLRLPDEAETRAKLRRDGETGTEIKFKPCQNVTNYQLPLKLPEKRASAVP